MIETDKRPGGFRKTRPGLFQALVVIAIIVAGGVVVTVMMATRKEVVRRPMRMPEPVVSVMSAHPGPMNVIVSGEGTASPLREIELVPQVSGRIVMMSPEMVDGGSFERGDTLLRIDPADYRLAVKSAEAKVKDLESALQLMSEESEAAIEEWRLLGDGRGEPPPLVAKRPQLEAARAGLQAGRADLERRRLDLSRTSILAPFDGIVSRKNVDLGQFVPAGMSLGSYFSTEAAEISVPLTVEELEWISVPGFTGGDAEGSRAVVFAELAGDTIDWPAKVMRAGGIIDERTRMVDVILRVEDPYSDNPPLAMGLFTRVEICGRMLEHALVAPRSAVHGNGTVWVVDGEGRLRFRQVDVARYEENDAIISSGLEEGDMIVTSPLKIVSDGMRVRIRNGEEPVQR